MKKEIKFISNCFNTGYRSKSRKALENLREKNLDWDFIFEKMLQSDIAPPAYHNLSGLKNNKIPPLILEKLKSCYYYALIRNQFIRDTLYEILNLFSAEDLSVLALKGIFMLDIIYEDIGSRSLADIDLLVKKNDLERTCRLLQDKGYRRIQEYPGQILYFKGGNSAEDRLRNILIEIHYDLNLPPPLSFSTDFLWHKVIIREVRGVRIVYPCLENNIIYAALHFFHHFSDVFIYQGRFQGAFPSLKSILDIHEIISRKQGAIDWDYILEFCRINKAVYIIYLSMYLSKIYFMTPIPKAFMNKIKPSFFRRIILKVFLSGYIDMQNSKITWKKLRIANCAYYSLLEKSYFRKRFLYPVSEFAKERRLPYPSFVAFFLYAIRFFLWLNILIFF
ncbi:MAG: nucleotidyltransferase family protein [Candidatus Omnitrophota bacterium]|jgi:hypothetical protein